MNQDLAKYNNGNNHNSPSDKQPTNAASRTVSKDLRAQPIQMFKKAANTLSLKMSTSNQRLQIKAHSNGTRITHF